MKRLAIAVVVLSAFAAQALAQSATVKVINQSKWELHHLFLSSSGEDWWGPDVLEDEILTHGDSITVTGIPCDVYDVKVTDEDGDECVIEQVDLCRDNSFWRVTNADLLECEGYE